jgi:hypothetical protein
VLLLHRVQMAHSYELACLAGGRRGDSSKRQDGSPAGDDAAGPGGSPATDDAWLKPTGQTRVVARRVVAIDRRGAPWQRHESALPHDCSGSACRSPSWPAPWPGWPRSPCWTCGPRSPWPPCWPRPTPPRGCRWSPTRGSPPASDKAQRRERPQWRGLRPLLIIFLTVAQAEEGVGHVEPVKVVLEQIGFGAVGGVVAGALGAWSWARPWASWTGRSPPTRSRA